MPLSANNPPAIGSKGLLTQGLLQVKGTSPVGQLKYPGIWVHEFKLLALI